MSIVRNKKIMELRLKGWTLRQIGEELGVSDGRIGVILRQSYRVYCNALDRRQRIEEVKKAGLDEVFDANMVTLKDLSARAHGVLYQADVRKIEDLARFSEWELLNMRGIGKKAFIEILNLMKLRGISCRGEDATS